MHGTLYQFCILANQGAAELQQTTEGASGYTAVTLPGGVGATEIVSLVDNSGTLHAFYATPSGVMHASRVTGGNWKGPDTLLAPQAWR